ncbi:hypothetical protein SISSUDRAFT_1056094 [Sistotremastrum suecicum HHB10207 ss-3]|uniref:Uncharacterized protein n=1 Tax=Sistotremastrum suecicum HHB10207 ss-3 TaxID=1314776 RepID=A0A165X9K8_9AGAM|nr:hypothetical protein SISSUDRAFT_1056094 [Sistotremastrum suecicum HHB10207 ss-3]
MTGRIQVSSGTQTVMARWGESFDHVGQLAGDGVKQYQDVLLSATDKRLCMGGLGRMDSQWEDSGWRMNEAFLRLRLGFGESDFVMSEHLLSEGRWDWGRERVF